MTIIVQTKLVEITFTEKNFFLPQDKRLTSKGKNDENNIFYLRPCITLPTNVTTENTSGSRTQIRGGNTPPQWKPKNKQFLRKFPIFDKYNPI